MSKICSMPHNFHSPGVRKTWHCPSSCHRSISWCDFYIFLEGSSWDGGGDIITLEKRK